MRSHSFLRSVTKIAVPVALQSMLQASFSIVDQIMVGNLGCTSVAAVGIAGKLSSLYGVVIGAVVSVAGIMISQYIGAKDEKEVNRSFCLNTSVSLVIAVIFMSVCLLLPTQLMSLYSTDKETVKTASGYLMIISFADGKWSLFPPGSCVNISGVASSFLLQFSYMLASSESS